MIYHMTIFTIRIKINLTLKSLKKRKTPCTRNTLADKLPAVEELELKPATSRQRKGARAPSASAFSKNNRTKTAANRSRLRETQHRCCLNSRAPSYHHRRQWHQPSRHGPWWLEISTHQLITCIAWCSSFIQKESCTSSFKCRAQIGSYHSSTPPRQPEYVHHLHIRADRGIERQTSKGRLLWRSGGPYQLASPAYCHHRFRRL